MNKIYKMDIRGTDCAHSVNYLSVIDVFLRISISDRMNRINKMEVRRVRVRILEYGVFS